MNQVTTADLYEASYYLVNDSEIEAITCREVNGKIASQITFKGDNLSTLQFNYFKGEAIVNLYNFRRAYSQVNNYLYEAKKKYKNKLKQDQTSLEGGTQ